MAKEAVRRRSAGEWSSLISRWKESGLTASAFAEREGVRASTLYWWSWKLGAPQEEPRIGLVPVTVVEDSPEPAISSNRWELRLADGTTVGMSGPDSVEGLATALRVLRGGGA